MVAPRARADASGSATGVVAALAYAGHHSSVSALPAMAASKSRSRKTYQGPTAEEKIVNSLIELMEAGAAPWRRPWRRPWDGSGGGHHVNLLSGHRYRGANPIHLTLGPRAGAVLCPSAAAGAPAWAP